MKEMRPTTMPALAIPLLSDAGADLDCELTMFENSRGATHQGQETTEAWRRAFEEVGRASLFFQSAPPGSSDFSRKQESNTKRQFYQRDQLYHPPCPMSTVI